MLVEILGNAPTVLSFRGEGQVFERYEALDAKSHEHRAEAVAEMICEGSDVGDKKGLHRFLLDSGRSKNESTLALWADGMARLASQREKTRWVQCATSYIFYVEDILRAFPDARMLCPIRNPLDIAASKKGRYWSRSDDLVRSLWGWNVGNRSAQKLAGEYPDRLMLLRYEDFVAKPEEELKKICSFCDVEHDPSYLRVPHTNRSRVQDGRSGEGEHGISTSRVFYYQDILSAQEEAVVRLVASDELLETWYPDLPAPNARTGWTHHVSAAWFVGQGLLATLSDQGRRAFRNPRYVLNRASRRLKRVFSVGA